MRNFASAISSPNSFVSCSGERFHVERTASLAHDGTVSLREVGRTDIQAMIDSHRDSTDLAYILTRLEAGDTSVLRSGGMYGDFTALPKTMAEAYQLVIDGQRKFDLLPEEIRSKFGFDFQRWFASAGSDSWLDLMGFKSNAPAQGTPSEPVLEASTPSVTDVKSLVR